MTGRAGRKKRPVCKTNLLNGEIIKEYSSLAEAGIKNDIKSSNICKVLSGERKSCGGFGWRYKKEVVL